MVSLFSFGKEKLGKKELISIPDQISFCASRALRVKEIISNPKEHISTFAKAKNLSIRIVKADVLVMLKDIERQSRLLQRRKYPKGLKRAPKTEMLDSLRTKVTEGQAAASVLKNRIKKRDDALSNVDNSDKNLAAELSSEFLEAKNLLGESSDKDIYGNVTKTISALVLEIKSHNILETLFEEMKIKK